MMAKSGTHPHRGGAIRKTLSLDVIFAGTGLGVARSLARPFPRLAASLVRDWPAV